MPRRASRAKAPTEAGQQRPRPKIGDVFRPYEFSGEGGPLYYYVRVPESLHRYRGLSPGAKLAWARLARYQGDAGEAFPSVPKLGTELGVGTTQARQYIRELEQHGFVLVSQARGTSSTYQFVWHAAFDGDVGTTRKAPLRKTGGVPLRKTGGLTPPLNRRTPLRKTEDEERTESSSSGKREREKRSRTSEIDQKLSQNYPPCSGSEAIERLQAFLGERHNRNSAELLSLIETDLSTEGFGVGEGFVDFLVARATGAVTNPAGLYRNLVRKYVQAERAAQARRIEAQAAIPQDDPAEKWPCCRGTGRAEGGYCSCRVGETWREIDRRIAASEVSKNNA